MTNYSEKLILKSKDAINNINESSVLYILVLLNKAVQDSYSISKFSSIGFYRDWLVHTDLDRNKHLEAFFEKWDRIFENIGKGVNVETSTHEVYQTLNLEKLFDEIKFLGITLNLSQKNLFLVALVNNLLDTPLRWKGVYIKEFRFTYAEERKIKSSSYVCHMQIQHVKGGWFDGPELIRQN